MDNSSDNAIREYRGSVEVFKVPEHVTVIGDAAFAGNKSLRHIDLGNVRSIGARAFQDCSNLESVTMSKAAVIGPGAFEFCRSLSSITFGDVTEIGAGAFSYCGNLDIPRIPRTLTSAGERAFSCGKLKSGRAIENAAARKEAASLDFIRFSSICN